MSSPELTSISNSIGLQQFSQSSIKDWFSADGSIKMEMLCQQYGQVKKCSIMRWLIDHIVLVNLPNLT